MPVTYMLRAMINPLGISLGTWGNFPRRNQRQLFMGVSAAIADPQRWQGDRETGA